MDIEPTLKSRLEVVKIHNVWGNKLKKDFHLNFDSEDFWIAAPGNPGMIEGSISEGYELWPRDLAEHFCHHMIDAIIIRDYQYEETYPTGRTYKIAGGLKLEDEALRNELRTQILEERKVVNPLTNQPQTEGQRLKENLAKAKELTEEVEAIPMDTVKESAEFAKSKDARELELRRMPYNELIKIASKDKLYKSSMRQEEVILVVLDKEFANA